MLTHLILSQYQDFWYLDHFSSIIFLSQQIAYCLIYFSHYWLSLQGEFIVM